MHAAGAGTNHGFHQLKGVQHAAETGLGIGNNRSEIVDVVLMAGFNALGALDFISATESAVDALNDLWNRVDGV